MVGKRIRRLAYVLVLVCFSGGSDAVEHMPQAMKTFEANGESLDLIVMLHAFSSDHASLRFARNVLMQNGAGGEGRNFRDADIFAPDLPFDVFSMAKPADVIADLLHRIDGLWNARLAKGGPYRRIYFVGHSMGALYARKLYVAACGENPDAPFEEEFKRALNSRGAKGLESPRDWARSVQRIVLLAGMNRGWSISHHMSLTRAAVMKVGTGIGHVMARFAGRLPIIFGIRRGSPFITQLRLQWLSMLRNSENKKSQVGEPIGTALTVQLLGSIDDLVSPHDNIDLVTGKDFVYLDVPESGHANVVQMDDSVAGRKRAATFLTAMVATPDTLRDLQVVPADRTEEIQPRIERVVFVIHGIRDEGFWTQKIARRVIAKGEQKGIKVASITSTYGYFPMLSFLIPGARQEKVEWLMDRYTEARAIYPNARFSYVGHSNGTYLLAKALRDYPAVAFDQIVFAGSVVRRDYEWSRFIPRQAKSVLNFVASADWVVAFFPNALQMLQVQDLGSAGHDGFDLAGKESTVFELAGQSPYVSGGHGAALGEAMWESIADFVLDGRFNPPPRTVLSDRQAWWVYYPAKVAPFLWILIVTALLFVLWRLLRSPMAEWAKTLSVVLYVWLVWTVITKV